MFEIAKEEKNELVTNCDWFNSLKHSITNPKAFTERGSHMIATILKGERVKLQWISLIPLLTLER
ncbi:MAG: ORF6N domain-containing protein [Rickettsiales bacterium]|nr:ORF6N domain-containing protein [Rickettsiales bacterium]